MAGWLAPPGVLPCDRAGGEPLARCLPCKPARQAQCQLGVVGELPRPHIQAAAAGQRQRLLHACFPRPPGEELQECTHYTAVKR